MFRKRLDEIQAQTTSEKEWWESRKSSIQADFMKEIEAESTGRVNKSAAKASSDEGAILVKGGGRADKEAAKKKNKK